MSKTPRWKLDKGLLESLKAGFRDMAERLPLRNKDGTRPLIAASPRIKSRRDWQKWLKNQRQQ